MCGTTKVSNILIFFYFSTKGVPVQGEETSKKYEILTSKYCFIEVNYK